LPAGKDRAGQVRRSKGLLGRAGWYAADQGISSLGNISVVVFIARLSDPEGFGAFAVAFATYVVVLGVATALGSEPLVIGFASDKEHVAEATRRAVGLSLAVGSVFAVPVLVVGHLLGGEAGSALLAMAVVLPAVVVQDGWRYGFFAQARPRAAACNDLLWTVFIFLCFGGIELSGRQPSVPTLILVWGAGGLAAAVFGAVQHGGVPKVSQARGWLRSQQHLGPSLLIDFVIMAGVVQLVFFSVAVVGGLAEAGALRAAQALFGPLNVVMAASRSFALPAAVRLVAVQNGLGRAIRRYALVMTGLAGSYAFVVSLLPDRLGEQLLGATWAATSVVVPLFALVVVARAPTLAAMVGLRALADGRRTLRARLLTSPLLLAGGIGGASVSGAAGAAIGLAVAQALGVLIWGRQFATAVKSTGHASGGGVA
jgi:O-antigen/teichoic acid export membrane protein